MKLISNFLFLFLSKGSGLMLFLIITPLLISRVGLEKLGLISVALGIVYIFDSFVEYSFNITIVQDISINRKDKNKVSETFVNTLFAKIILLISALIIYFLMISLVDKFRQEFMLYLFAFTFVIGRSINPLWYFMGIEKMHFITITSLISKGFYLFLIFFFIKAESDYIKVNLFYGISEIISSIIALIYVSKFEKLNFTKISIIASMKLIIRDYKFSMALFLNKVYSNIPIIFLGIFSTPLNAGIYSVADKIVANFRDIIGLFYNSVMPYFSNLFIKSKKLTTYKIWLVSFSIIVLFILSLIPLNYFSINIIAFFTSERIYEVNSVFLILILSVVIIIMRLPHSIYVTLKRLDDYFLLTAIVNTFFTLIVCLIGVKFFGAKGAAFSVIVGEFSALVALSFFLLSKHKQFYTFKRPTQQVMQD